MPRRWPIGWSCPLHPLNKNGSPADGFRFGGAVGYGLNEYVTLGLGVRYEMSSEVEGSSNSSYTGYTTKSTRSQEITQVAIVPDVVFALPGEVYRPYMRCGWHIGFPTLNYKYEYVSTSTTGVDRSYELESTGGLAQGFLGGIGIEYRVTPTLGILAEISSESWTWGPTESKYTKYVSDGVDQLGSMNTSEKEIEYVDSYTDVADQDTTKASKELRRRISATALSLNIGLRLQF